MLVLLVLRRWQLKHDGRLPESVGDLVGDALPAIPVDPQSGWRGEPPRPFTLNKTGRPFAFTFEYAGIAPVVVPPGTPYLTSTADRLEDFVEVSGDSLVEEGHRVKRSLNGPAWPVWTPEERPQGGGRQ